MQVSWGPQHPASGHLRFILDVDGDSVLNLEPDVGYTHRGIEKLTENRTYLQNIPVVERINSYCDATNTVLGYIEVVEELLECEVPERARFIRVIMAEMNRIASHLYWLCLMSISVGFETMLMWTMNERELFLDLFEMITGARITYSALRPGGVRYDIPHGFEEVATKYLNHFERRLKDYYKMIFENSTFRLRTIGVGSISSSDAIKLGLVGPCLRASGVATDVRKDEPYEVYQNFDFNIPVEKAGDAYARSLIRFHEMEESVSIIRQALRSIPEGPIRKRVPLVVPKGEAYSRVEAARGELGYYLVANGTDKPYRLKVSTPSFRNMAALPYITRNVTIADIPAIYMSLDLIPLDIDR
ncbi:NADH-quinone oxidoreductase subunit D [Candidatus Bathyarchaeota archaeon]|nr:NADH-quinone oxidoreductase subunit D [Candidatus Bathyarchaeota archaeon]